LEQPLRVRHRHTAPAISAPVLIFIYSSYIILFVSFFIKDNDKYTVIWYKNARGPFRAKGGGGGDTPPRT
jgi:hypothetical protein